MTTEKKFMFSAPVSQEFSSMIEEIARELGVRVRFSPIACTVGELGLYASFTSMRLKQAFLEAIDGYYTPEEVWAA